MPRKALTPQTPAPSPTVPVEKSAWVSAKEAAQIIGTTYASFRSVMMKHPFHRRLAYKKGKRWYFNRAILEKYGIVYSNEHILGEELIQK